MNETGTTEIRHRATVTYTYEGKQVLRDVTLDVPAHAVRWCSGRRAAARSTLLRLINRLNDLVDGTSLTGHILIDGQDIYAPGTDGAALRRRVGMVFALPLPLPGTIRENIIYGPRLAGERNVARLEEIVMRSLKAGRALGRGEGPAGRAGHVAVRRPAAAAVHRPQPGAGAGDAAARRAHLGPGSDLDRQGGGVALRAARSSTPSSSCRTAFSRPRAWPTTRLSF